MNRPFEIGLYTFGEIAADPTTGLAADPAVRLREFIALAKIADEVGLDVFGVGEHHRPDFAISSPPVVLAAELTPSHSRSSGLILPTTRGCSTRSSSCFFKSIATSASPGLVDSAHR